MARWAAGSAKARPRPLVIVGAGRQGRNVRDICQVLGVPVLGYLDDTKAEGEEINGAAVLGGFERVGDPALNEQARWIVALGECRPRYELSRQVRERGGELCSIIHPDSFVSPSARLGEGILVQAYSRVMANATIGDFAVVDGLASVGVDAVLGEAAFVGPGSTVTAGAVLGPRVFLGAHSVVFCPQPIGADAVIGAGSVVIHEVPPNSVVVGNPARVIRQN